MLFHTPEFFVLLVVSLILYYLLPDRRIALLTVANWIFYGVNGPGFLALFLAVSTVTFACALLMRGKYRALFMSVSIGVNALNLCFFKYSLFVLQNLERMLDVPLVREQSLLSSIVLPVGISFYTFELISYTVDVYKGKLAPSRNLLQFWIFVAFFAHLIAGPIMRGHEFLPQIDRLREIRWDAAAFRLGAFYLLLGLCKKMMLADYLTPQVDGFFSATGALTGSEGWVAAYLFAFQIYCDFSAYSDMAVGIAHLFGLRLMANFMTPYLSANATEFWRRWHITLSSWIRDYIYIPLGGSRKGKWLRNVNLFAAMTISGLWHGAQWTFVAWGAYHGLLLILHKGYVSLKSRLGGASGALLDRNIIYRMLSVAVFFHLTCIGWVLFRAQSGLREALKLIGRMVRPEAFLFPPELAPYLWAVAGLFALHVSEFLLMKHLDAVSRAWHRHVPAPVRAAVYVLVVVSVSVFTAGEHNAFIYFQF